MTVLTTNNKVRQEGDGTSTGFPFTFKVFSDEDIRVISIADADGAETVVDSADYSVSLNTDGEGGTVTFNTAPAADVDILLKRELDVTQEINIPRSSNIPEQSLENGYDKAIMLIQDIFERLSRAILLTEGTTLENLQIPSPVANKALKWDATGAFLENSTNDFDDLVTDAQAAQTGAEAAQVAAEGAQTGAEAAQAAAETAQAAAELARDTAISQGITMYLAQSISASGNINHTDRLIQYRRIQGDGAPVTTATTPFGTNPANFVDGMRIILVGLDNTNTVEIPFADINYGCLLNGDAVLGRGQTVTLVYDETITRYVELTRNF